MRTLPIKPVSQSNQTYFGWEIKVTGVFGVHVDNIFVGGFYLWNSVRLVQKYVDFFRRSRRGFFFFFQTCARTQAA